MAYITDNEGYLCIRPCEYPLEIHNQAPKLVAILFNRPGHLGAGNLSITGIRHCYSNSTVRVQIKNKLIFDILSSGGLMVQQLYSLVRDIVFNFFTKEKVYSTWNEMCESGIQCYQNRQTKKWWSHHRHNQMIDLIIWLYDRHDNIITWPHDRHDNMITWPHDRLDNKNT